MRRRAGIVALSLALAAAVVGCGGQGTGRRTALVYAVPTSFGASDAWIWRARADGTHAVRLTRGLSPQLAPAGV